MSVERLEVRIREIEEAYDEADKGGGATERKKAGGILRGLREEAGFELEDLAREAGIKYKTLDRAEKGEIKLGVPVRARLQQIYSRPPAVTGPQPAVRTSAYLLELMGHAENVYIGKSFRPFRAAKESAFAVQLISLMAASEPTTIHYVFPDPQIGMSLPDPAVDMDDLGVAKATYEEFELMIPANLKQYLKPTRIPCGGLSPSELRLIQGVSHFASWVYLEYKKNSVPILYRTDDFFVELPCLIVQNPYPDVKRRPTEKIVNSDEAMYVEIDRETAGRWFKAYKAELDRVI